MAMLFGREIDLLCLDMDDTLINTEGGVLQRFEDATRAIRRIRPEIAPAAIQQTIDRVVEVDPHGGRFATFVADLDITDPAEIQAIRDAYFETMTDVDIFDGVYDVLATLRERFRLAIITNGPSDLQRRKVAAFDFEQHVDWIVISGEVGADRPDPAIFQHTLQLAGVEASRAAHVGDSLLADVAGANSAGILSVWLETHFPRSQPEGDEYQPAATIQHVRELLEA
jgi:HAD superfamily hydrolase (TIGR01549 family)